MKRLKYKLKNVNLKLVIFFVFCCVFCFCYSNFLFVVDNDEIWNYGFSYNISQGMVIYRDFNALQTPLYFFIGSFFVKIFGNYLFSLHILDAIIVGIMMLFFFKRIGWKSLWILLVMVIFLVPSYNLLSLFLLILIILLIDSKKDKDFYIGIIVGLSFLTKQNIGVLLFVPFAFYSKNKIKAFLYFLLPIFIFLVYLLINNAMFDFVNCCFLGLFDFNDKNMYIDNLILFYEFIVVCYLGYKFVKSKFKDKTLCYILIFQLFLYPIVNLQHFLVAFVPVIVYIFMYEKNNFITKFVIPLVILFYFCLYTASYYVGLNLNLDNNFLYLRNTKISEYLSSEVEIILEYSKDFNYEFFIVDNAYMRKFFLDIPIGRYDFLLNGNMGYQGGEGGRKFVNEIDSICSKNSCVFFVDEGIKNSRYGQFNKEIYNYVVNNYKKCIEHEYLSVFTN